MRLSEEDMQQMVDYMLDLDYGRFRGVLKLGCKLKPVCMCCGYFNPNRTEMYRCASIPGCPGVTLSSKVKEYLWREMDE